MLAAMILRARGAALQADWERREEESSASSYALDVKKGSSPRNQGLGESRNEVSFNRFEQTRLETHCHQRPDQRELDARDVPSRGILLRCW